VVEVQCDAITETRSAPALERLSTLHRKPLPVSEEKNVRRWLGSIRLAVGNGTVERGMLGFTFGISLPV
jgi:hypothetical protein